MRAVLLVDDEIPMLEAVAGMFVARGWDVTTSRNGTDAVARASERDFDLVVSDVVMEGIVGTALLEEIRAVSGTYVPVIFMSNMPERRVRGIVEGEYGFLRKPFRGDDLMRAVSAVLGMPDPDMGGGMVPPAGHGHSREGRSVR